MKLSGTRRAGLRITVGKKKMGMKQKVKYGQKKTQKSGNGNLIYVLSGTHE